MERSSLIRWLLIGAALFLFLQFGLPAIQGETSGDVFQPILADDSAPPADQRKAENICKLKGERFSAELSTKGGVLKHVVLEGDKYVSRADEAEGPEPIDLVSTSVQSVMPLRTNLREPSGTANQIAFDDVDWDIHAQTKSSCTFVYSDDDVAMKKVITAGKRPFELEIELTVTNKASDERTHRLTIEQTDYRTQEETSGSWGRVSAWLTKTESYSQDEVHRFEPGDFDPDDFADEDFTAEKWRRTPGDAHWASVSTSYFSKAIFHVDGPGKPFGEHQIEEVWNSAQFKQKSNDPSYGHIYRARLNYGIHKLAPEAFAKYKFAAFVGPKERQVLTEAIGGTGYADQLLDLGIFGWIGKLLIGYLYILFGFTKTWGWAICLLTITIKLLMFPLSITQIKSSMAMRTLKPEMDEINKKYKEDATQRGLAMQELWRKNNVTNPMLGCLPVMLQMPVWFALYTALQTAVELYNTSFFWFPDLSSPDSFYILPVLLGASSFLQQHLMPMQGDAMQQKMMKYLMPGMFTVFMLFLPAGLGIYFLTNTWLGIGQQLAVERYYKSQEGKGSSDDSDSDDGDDEEDAKPAKKSKSSKSEKRDGAKVA